MRLSRSPAPVTVVTVVAACLAALTLVLCVPYDASPHARVGPQPGRAAAPAPGGAAEEPAGAECRTSVEGSHVVAYCHNPYAATDRVRLHVECARWWDLDTDGAATEVGPAETVRLTARCWKEVDAAWVSHARP
ncbi:MULTISPECIES: hypothetical protein [unclassified Streptomyces]|uniref:hypothetical protein n=1 Tax=unclassified Streptomyces TaxID=2593676 RepID=UPI003823537C